MAGDITILTAVIRILLAFVCGGIIGTERLLRGRAAGIRTHLIVCMGSALTILVGLYAFSNLGLATDPLRIGAQVVSGIGFLGVGTILIEGRKAVTGLTTAAGLWTTAAIGLAFGAGCYALGLIVTALTFIAIFFVSKFETYLDRHRREYQLYIEMDDIRSVRQLIEELETAYMPAKVDVTPPRSASSGNVGIEIVFTAKKIDDMDQVKNNIKNLDHVVLVLDSV